MSDSASSSGICGRIGQLREELHGPRGKAAFAAQLGISPSTYNYYEGGRVPPAEVLVRIADAAGVDLRWLLTGEVSPAAVPADHPAVQRIVRVLAESPEAAEPLTAFVELLAESLAWPAKDKPAEVATEAPAASQDHAPGTAEPPLPGPAAGLAQPPAEPKRDWIPLLGRSAAGMPQFWDDRDQAAGVTALAELVERHARRAGRRVRSAVADDETSGTASAAQIITLSAPDADNVAEFIVAGTMKQRYPDAFAVRIDGDSMVPEIRHGDVVICSGSVGPADGRPALVQLVDQVGVTCKIYRSAGRTVHLVPVNEQYPPQAFPAEQVVWARRVLARVRAS